MPVPQHDVKLQGRISGTPTSSYDTVTSHAHTFEDDIIILSPDGHCIFRDSCNIMSRFPYTLNDI